MLNLAFLQILGEPVSFPCSLPPASSPLQLRFLQLENYGTETEDGETTGSDELEG
ncbi:hypothetical protein SLEP1_g15198 [Rubroshorea leprosula]|uniref:Uncharacterized protein n=1 Tax=Rubroshorea leprosula TaxID=152421 RepID=A0AAV5ILK9_9ROSI|nr:hypothetical protein SLEP1_g15198 [Rubroshorea leprosula]